MAKLIKTITCKICNKECKNILSLISHLRNIHKVNSKNYYDKYIKKENEGFCIECGKETIYLSIPKGYNKFCSTKCSYKSNYIKEKRKNTFLKKYGVENPGQNINIKEKIKQTNLEKYGGTGFQIKELYDKSKKTMLKKYNIYHPINSEEIKNKIKQTNLDKYGTENPFQSERIKEKIKQINLEKYGVENISQNKKIIEKINNTKKLNIINKIKLLFKDLDLELISEYNDYFGKINIKCLKCLNIFESEYGYLKQGYGKCPNCFPNVYGISKIEIELLKYIESIEQSEIYKNSRNILDGMELDIYIPDKNIAIEFNGLYWHSEEQGKDKNYHLNKTKLCESKKIRLIHIFEDEWIFKQDIVKSRLRHILCLNNSKKIYARKCKIKKINSKLKNEFLITHHLQGEDKSNIKLGAFYNDELVSVMTFSKGNISKGSKNIDNVFELNRFCSDSSYHIPGIASKLLSHFKRNYKWKEIYSYVDRRWSDGNVYKQIGFELDSITKPNYWYIKGLNRIHRFNLRKRYDEPKDIPEWTLRQQEGFDKIWDCGRYKFRMDI